MKQMAVIVTVVIAVGAAAAGLVWWLVLSPPPDVDARLPGADEAAAAGATVRVDIEGTLERFRGAPSALTGSWPQFRGAHRDARAPDSAALADTWPAGGPEILWSVALGEGYAGPAVANGCVYVLDYDAARGGDALRCFSLDDGREIWRRWYRVRVKRNHGMSRTVPAVDGTSCVSIGPRCHVLAVDARTGAYRWSLDLVNDFGAEVPLWYTGQCPLLEGGTVVLAPAGRALLLGVDAATGAVLWETPNPRGWKMSHSSVMPFTCDGVRMYVYAAIGGIAGVAADGPDRGRLLWETEDWTASVVAPSPVDLGDGRLFVTSGYGKGSLLLQVARSGESFVVSEVYRLDKTEFACEQQTPVYVGGRLFGVMPPDAGALRGQLVCYDPAARAPVWNSGSAERFGLGPFLVADGRLLVLGEDGTLTMAAAAVDGYAVLARARVLDGREAWAPLALADGRLLARDERKMVCLDVGRTADGHDGKTDPTE